MKIKSVHIKYFRSIYNQNIELGSLNIIAGLNDSGKSNLLKALNLFFKNETGWREPFSFAKDFNLRRAREFNEKILKDAKEIVIKLTFDEINGSVPVWEKKWRLDGEVIETLYDGKLKRIDRTESGFKSRSKIPAMLKKVDYIYVPALKGPEYISFLIGRLSNILSEKASLNIRNAAKGFESELATYLSDITSDIKSVLKIDSLLKLPYDLINIFENMEFSNNDGIGLTHRGDGVGTRHIPILLNKISSLHDVLKDKSELHSHFIWGYEEPENNIELSSSFEMGDQFLSYSKNHQILITTHSAAFYGLPERNNSQWSQGDSSIYRYTSEYETNTTQYNKSLIDELDPIFLLPVITPYITKANDEVRRLKQEIALIEGQVNFFAKPAILVEGESDKIVMEKGLEIFFPELKDGVQIIYPKDSAEGGGANYVKDHLIIWETKQRHLPPAERVKAIGFFDDDPAGKEALYKYKEICKNAEYGFGQLLKIKFIEGDHFHKLINCNLRAKITCDLEHLYSPKLWKLARSKKYLEVNSNPQNSLAPEVIGELLTTKKTLEEFCEDEYLLMYVKYNVIHEKKTKLARFIAAAEDNDAKDYLYIFERILNSALKKLEVLT